MKRLDPRLYPEKHGRVLGAIRLLSHPDYETTRLADSEIRAALGCEYQIGPDLTARLYRLAEGRRCAYAARLIADYAPPPREVLRRMLLDPGSLDQYQRGVLAGRCLVPEGDDVVNEWLDEDRGYALGDALLGCFEVLPESLVSSLYRRYRHDPVRGPLAARRIEAPSWVKRDAARRGDPAFQDDVRYGASVPDDPAMRVLGGLHGRDAWPELSEATAPDLFAPLEGALREIEEADPAKNSLWKLREAYRTSLRNAHIAGFREPRDHRLRLIALAQAECSPFRADAQCILVEEGMHLGEGEALRILGDAVERRDSVVVAGVLDRHVIPDGDERVMQAMTEYGDFVGEVVLAHNLGVGARVIRHLYEQTRYNPALSTRCVSHPGAPLSVLQDALLRRGDDAHRVALANSHAARKNRSIRASLLREPSAGVASTLLIDGYTWEADELVRVLLRKNPSLALEALERPRIRQACSTITATDLAPLFALEDPLAGMRAMALLPLLPEAAAAAPLPEETAPAAQWPWQRLRRWSGNSARRR
jgi:hypothetical protein